MARWGRVSTRIVQLLIVSLLVVPNTTIANNDAISNSGKKSTAQRKASAKYAKGDSPQASTNRFNFRNTSWGMSPAEVKSSESAEFIVSRGKQGEEEQVAGMPAKVANVPAKIHYSFANDRLISGTYWFEGKYSDLNKHVDDFLKLQKMLVQEYGKPQQEGTTQFSGRQLEDAGDAPQNWGLALERGDSIHNIEWKTASTSIELAITRRKSEVFYWIAYESADHSHKVKAEKDHTPYDNVSIGYMTYVVWGVAEWSRSLSDNEYLDQRPNAAYLKVRMAARNNDTIARAVPPFTLVDEQGAEYKSTSKAWVRSDSFDLETLNPSVTKQGVVIFDVPPDRQYRLKVSGGTMSGEYAYIKLWTVDNRDIGR